MEGIVQDLSISSVEVPNVAVTESDESVSGDELPRRLIQGMVFLIFLC